MKERPTTSANLFFFFFFFLRNDWIRCNFLVYKLGFTFSQQTLLHTICKALLILQKCLSRCDTILYCPRQVHSRLNTTTIKQGFPPPRHPSYCGSLEYSKCSLSFGVLFIVCCAVIRQLASWTSKKGLCQFMMKWREQARETEKEKRGEEGKTSTQNGLPQKCMLINGCSINQWNIIKFKQCDFVSHLLKAEFRHGSLQGLRWPQFPWSKGQLCRLSLEGVIDPGISHA